MTLFNVPVLQKVLTIFGDKIVYGGVTALSQIIFQSCKAKDHLNSIYVGSNEIPFTAWKHTERNRQRDRKKYVMIS